jgi:AraC-like DNA-binding protein
MEPPRADAALSLDLSQIEVLQRVAAWRNWMRTSFPEFTLGELDVSASGTARVVSLGDARLWLLRLPPGRVRRTPDPTSPRDAFVLCQLEGSGSIARDGLVHPVTAGRVYIGKVAPDGAEVSADEATSFLLLELPSSYLTSRDPQLAGLRFHACAADQPGAVMLRELLQGTFAVGERLAAHERSIALGAIVELVLLPLSALRTPDPYALRVDRTLARIAERLADPRLDASTLARAEGISRRRLDELFVRFIGSPVAACITERRLLRAAELLRDAAQGKLSVAMIALRVGFADASYFSRSFKLRFGTVPRAWRAGKSAHPSAPASQTRESNGHSRACEAHSPGTNE